MLPSSKFGAVIAAIPLSIIAALYCVLFAYVAMTVGDTGGKIHELQSGYQK